jgi:two-component system, response regulator PdtaR
LVIANRHWNRLSSRWLCLISNEKSVPNGPCVFRNAGKNNILSSGNILFVHDVAAWWEAMKISPVVLVVEDDWLLKLLAVEIVEDAGFVAVEAANADEAVAILERRTDIALVFTDVDMPGSMDGLRLAHAVRDRWPPVKIIIVSGKTHLSEADLPSDTRFFSKPYSVPHMISQLKSLMPAPSS